MARFPKAEHMLMMGANAARVAYWAWFGISWVPNSPVEHMVICKETLMKLASRSEALDLTFPALCNTYLFCFHSILSTLHIKSFLYTAHMNKAQTVSMSLGGG